MNDKLTTSMFASVLSLLALAACESKPVEQPATPAAGALINAAPKTVAPTTPTTQPLDTSATTIQTAPTPAPAIAPQQGVQPIAPTQPAPTTVPPTGLGGARFGLRARAARKIVHLA